MINYLSPFKKAFKAFFANKILYGVVLFGGATQLIVPKL